MEKTVRVRGHTRNPPSTGFVYSLFSDSSPIDAKKFAEVTLNPKKYLEQVKKKAMKKYKTLFSITLEPAGHIMFRFKGKKERVLKDMAELVRELRKKGVATSEIWGRGVLELGNTAVGAIESLTIEVLSKY